MNKVLQETFSFANWHHGAKVHLGTTIYYYKLRVHNLKYKWCLIKLITHIEMLTMGMLEYFLIATGNLFQTPFNEDRKEVMVLVKYLLNFNKFTSAIVNIQTVQNNNPSQAQSRYFR